MNRRIFLLTGSTALLLPLAACNGGEPTAVDARADAHPTCGDDELDRVLCREDLFLNSAPNYVTAGMLIGAGLGAGLAIAGRFHPGAAIASVVVGSMVGGGIGAVDAYIQYRMKEADGDLVRAKNDVRRDISHDSYYSKVAVIDSQTLVDATRKAIKNENHHLLANADLLEKARQGRMKIGEVVKMIDTTNAVYRSALPRFGMSMEPKPQSDIVTAENNARVIKDREHMQYVLEMGRDA